MVRRKKNTHFVVTLLFTCLYIFILPHISFAKEIAFFFLPLPFIILSALAPYPSLGINIVFVICLYGWLGKEEAAGFLLGIVLFSWVAGFLMYYSFQVAKALWISIIVGILGTGIFLLISGEDYISKWQDNFDQAVAESISYYKKQGVEEEKLELISEGMKRIGRIFVLGFPAIFIISIIVFITSNYFLARYILGSLGYGNTPVLSNYWRLPDAFIWVFIVASFFIFLGKAFDIGAIFRAGLNFMILVVTTYLLQGLVLVNFFLNKWKWPLILRVFLYIILLFQPIFLMLIAMLGIFDVWFNFRRLEVKGVSP